ncbi:hypothetical protein TNCV_4845211 [Trichonephila clavipes]|uniref:Uncharacterized protein n=1 Tax=Trichonephila clavipes TaxID=2585209 RepID=A0A8X6WKV6_TRICX|nr:hypothetical protein TNCV_4845211 [Trichonephila clavipes]
MSLEQKSLQQVYWTFQDNNITSQILISYRLSLGNAPTVQKMSRSWERARTGKERLYPLFKGHTTQVTASKARQGHLKNPEFPAL